MNSKNIKRHLGAKMRDWLSSIDNDDLKEVIKNNTIVTGGAIVSLLTGEPVNDYDVYFKTKEACLAVAGYYVEIWNKSHEDKPVQLRYDEATGKIDCFIQSKGIADEDEEDVNSIAYNFDTMDVDDTPAEDEVSGNTKEKYRPRFITSNAITLSDKIQIVTRFYGDVDEIHKNYDFVHCTCAWSSWDNQVFLPSKALECIINKELVYVGSRYPLCSIVRTRKYIDRGFHINAGQYVKMCMQLNELNLKDVNVLEDQLTGVDTAYFQMLIEEIKKNMEATGNDSIDSSYVIQLIDKLF